jgi:DNA-binding transcriptional MocR family regulator
VVALIEVFDRKLELLGEAAGLHLALRTTKNIRDNEIAIHAAMQKLWLWPLSPSYLTRRPGTGFVLGFAGTPTREMPHCVRRFREVLRKEGR